MSHCIKKNLDSPAKNLYFNNSDIASRIEGDRSRASESLFQYTKKNLPTDRDEFSLLGSTGCSVHGSSQPNRLIRRPYEINHALATYLSGRDA